jgi:tetratricopeptide (TPR) repeat protein
MTKMRHLTSRLREVAQAIASGNYEAAHRLCLDFLREDGPQADAFHLLGVIAATHDNHAKAAELFQRAILMNGDEARFRADLARSFVALSRREEAIAEAETAARLTTQSARTLDTIGVVFSRTGLHARAVEFYERSLRLDPGNAGVWYNLGAALQFVGEFERARTAYRGAIERDPRHVRAWSALIGMSRQIDLSDVEALRALFDASTSAEDRLHVGHALAKIHEDLGDPGSAMTWLAAAKAAKRAEIGDGWPVDAALFEAAAATVGRVDAGARGQAPEGPIFVVGLPRTGTTLVDRILSSHSRIASAGELSDFAIAIKQAVRTPSPFVLDAETLRAGPSADLAAVGEAYLKRARTVAGAAPRFIDKMPLNVFFVPLILAAFPKARVICLKRNAADAALSNYRQLFATRFSYYAYAFDLGWTGRYVAGFERLTALYRERLPPDRYTEARYESIVRDLEGEARRLVAFCGEGWEPACLNFHENTAPVATASSAQVRQPLYRSSLGRWRAYRDHMGPALEALRAEGIDFED